MNVQHVRSRRRSRPILPQTDTGSPSPISKKKIYRHIPTQPGAHPAGFDNFINHQRPTPSRRQRPQSARHFVVSNDSSSLRRPSSASVHKSRFIKPHSGHTLGRVSSAISLEQVNLGDTRVEENEAHRFQRPINSTTRKPKPDANIYGSQNNHRHKSTRVAYSDWYRGFEADLTKFTSVALLCRLKFDQAKVLAGAWNGEPVRLRTAMALTCMEKLVDSLPGEQRELMAELVDEMMRSVFCDVAKEDLQLHPVTGADVLDMDGYQTYFDRCKTLLREVKSLRAQLTQMQQEARSATRVAGSKRGSVGTSSQITGIGIQDGNIDAGDAMVNIHDAFASLGVEDQQHIVTDLVLEMDEAPSLSTALTVVNGMNPNDRAELCELLQSSNSHDNFL